MATLTDGLLALVAEVAADIKALRAAKADLVSGTIPNSQLPLQQRVFPRPLNNGGIPTAAECVTLGYPDDTWIYQDPS